MSCSWEVPDARPRPTSGWAASRLAYLCCAVDKQSRTGDFYLRWNARRGSGQVFLAEGDEELQVHTTEDYAGCPCRLISGDRGIEGRKRIAPWAKQRLRSMLGTKKFGNAAVTISGDQVSTEGQEGPIKTGKLDGRRVNSAELWNAALAA